MRAPLVIVLTLILSTLAPFLPARGQSESETFLYARDFIISLSYAKAGLDHEHNIQRPTYLELLNKTKLAIAEYEKAARTLEEYTHSNDEVIQVGSDVTLSTYVQLIETNRAILAEIQDLSRSESPAFDYGAFIDRVSDLMVEQEQAWKNLLPAAISVTYVLRESSEEGEELDRLGITTEEKRELIARIDRTFGESVKGGQKASQEAVVGAAAELYEFLSQPEWKGLDEK